MGWSSYKVIAAKVAYELGVYISNPFIRDESGKIFFVTDNGVETPIPNLYVSRRELDELTANGWVHPIPEWPAEKDKEVIALSAQFIDVLGLAGFEENLDWTKLENGQWWAYVNRIELSEWMGRCGRALLAFAEPKLAAYLKNPEVNSSDYKILERVLWNATFCFSCDSKRGNGTYADIILLNERNPILFERRMKLFFAGISPEDAENIVATQRKKLLAL